MDLRSFLAAHSKLGHDLEKALLFGVVMGGVDATVQGGITAQSLGIAVAAAIARQVLIGLRDSATTDPLAELPEAVAAAVVARLPQPTPAQQEAEAVVTTAVAPLVQATVDAVDTALTAAAPPSKS